MINERQTDTIAKLVATELKRVIDSDSDTSNMSLALAKRLISCAEAEAERQGLAVAVAVCDSHGNAVAAHAMDGTLIIGFDIAIKKAYTSAAMRMPTSELAGLCMPGGQFYGLTHSDKRIIIFGGGEPIYGGSDGSIIIGGLGVSGGSDAQDAEIACAALSTHNIRRRM